MLYAGQKDSVTIFTSFSFVEFENQKSFPCTLTSKRKTACQIGHGRYFIIGTEVTWKIPRLIGDTIHGTWCKSSPCLWCGVPRAHCEEDTKGVLLALPRSLPRQDRVDRDPR